MGKYKTRTKAQSSNEATTIRIKRKKTTEWTREAALQAIELEDHYSSQQRIVKTPAELVIKFPDPEISEEVVKNFSEKILAIQFPQPITPRECIVKLKDCDTKKTIKELSKIKFGNGKLLVMEKQNKFRPQPEEIDPLTLHFSNLSNTKITILKKILKNTEILIAQNKRKHAYFAFAKFKTFDDAVQAFRKCMRKFPPTQFINIRFKRTKVCSADKSSQEDTIDGENGSSLSDKNSEAEPNDEQISKLESTSHNGSKQVNSSQRMTDTISIKSTTTSSNRDEFDTVEIKIEPGAEKYLGFRKDSFNDEDMDGETDCSNSSYRYDSNSVGSIDKISKRRRSSSSVFSVTDSDDEPLKKPKLLVLPILHGSLCEVKKEVSDTSDDDISVIEDLDLI